MKLKGKKAPKRESKAIRIKAQVVAIPKCPRCGKVHELLAIKFKRTTSIWTHWSKCPNTGEPITMAYTPSMREEK